MNSTDIPIFVVGAPRSGTTLLTAMLSASNSIASGPETQFFNKLCSKQLLEATSDKNWPEIAVKLLTSLKLANQRVHELYNVSAIDLNSYLVVRKPSVNAMLEAFVHSNQIKKLKNRWLEKTPNHLLHVDSLRRYYPKAKIIRIIRDPRDSALSMCALPWASKSVIENAALINEWYGSSSSFFKHDINSITIRYENLIQDAQIQLLSICEFIEEPFDEAMLTTNKSSKNIITPNEPWKSSVGMPLNTERVYAWKNSMETSLFLAASLAAYDVISEFKYENFIVREKKALLLLGINKERVVLDECSKSIVEMGLQLLLKCKSKNPNIYIIESTNIFSWLKVSQHILKLLFQQRLNFKSIKVKVLALNDRKK
jgi:hypothetical protein